MARFVDLDLLVDVEPLQFKVGEDIYEIPGTPTTELTLKFMALDQKRFKSKDPKEQFELLAEIVAMLLSQGEKEVTKEFVIKKFHPIQMNKIVEEFTKNLQQIESNPN